MNSLCAVSIYAYDVGFRMQKETLILLFQKQIFPACKSV